MAGAGLCTKEVSPGVDDNEAYSSIRIFLRRVTFCEKYCERLRASYLYKRDSSYYFNKLVPCDMKRLFRFKRSISNAKTVVKGELYSTYIDFSDIRQNLNNFPNFFSASSSFTATGIITSCPICQSAGVETPLFDDN